MSELIDLSKLAPPDAVVPVDYEAILAAALADLKTRFKKAGLEFDVDGLETDPVVIEEEARSYREMLVLQRINDAIRAVLLARSEGADLEQIAADFNLKRRTIKNATDTENAILESDDELKHRRQLAPEGYAAGGSEDAYRSIILNALTSIVEVKAVKGVGNIITLVLLARDGDGTVTSEDIAAASLAASPLKTRPLTDSLYIRGPDVNTTAIRVRLEVGAGPDISVLEQAAQSGLIEYVKSRRLIGSVLYLDGIVGAARTAKPIERVVVLEPVSDIDPGRFGVVNVSGIEVEVIRV